MSYNAFWHFDILTIEIDKIIIAQYNSIYLT